MPTYVYKCEVCGHQFERVMKMSDANPPCPRTQPPERIKEVGSDAVVAEEPVASCGGATKKLIVGGTFHLIGKGWASDGYS